MKHRIEHAITHIKPGQPESHGGAWMLLGVFIACIGFVVAGVAFLNHTTLP